MVGVAGFLGQSDDVGVARKNGQSAPGGMSDTLERHETVQIFHAEVRHHQA